METVRCREASCCCSPSNLTFAYREFVCQCLQFAVHPASRACLASWQLWLERISSRLTFLASITLGVCVKTSMPSLTRGEHMQPAVLLAPLYLDDTHTAAADLVDVLEVAERRDVDVHFLGSFQYSIVFRHIKVYAVYGYIHFVHIVMQPPFRYAFLSMDLNGHFSIQTPHLTHLS